MHELQRKRDTIVGEKYRAMLIERYGNNGESVECVEAFELCEYGTQITKEEIEKFFYVYDY